MRFIGVVGILVAFLGLLGGPISFMTATTVLQQIVGATGTMTGMLGLIAAALGIGLADLRDIAREAARAQQAILSANREPA
jgi:hypothetical protein